MTSTPLLRKHLCCKKWGLGENKVASGIGWLYMNDESFFSQLLLSRIVPNRISLRKQVAYRYHTDYTWLLHRSTISCVECCKLLQAPQFIPGAEDLCTSTSSHRHPNQTLPERMYTHVDPQICRSLKTGKGKEKDRIDRIQLTGLWMALV
jgi:hypothetical protein